MKHKLLALVSFMVGFALPAFSETARVSVPEGGSAVVYIFMVGTACAVALTVRSKS